MKKEKFDYSLLKSKIKTIFVTQASFARAMHLSPTALSDKLNNKVQFKQDEINNACRLLSIDVKEISSYFFKVKVKVA